MGIPSSLILRQENFIDLLAKKVTAEKKIKPVREFLASSLAGFGFLDMYPFNSAMSLDIEWIT